MRVRCLTAICLMLGVLSPAYARIHLRSPLRRHSSVTLRKRLHVNDLITEPGTVEIDWGNLYSFTGSNFTMPSALKHTPEGNSFLWGRTEYSVAFDSVSSALDVGNRTTQFSDRISFAATSILLDTTHFDIGIASQATAILRDDSGMRLGATLIAREDIGLNSMGVTAGWSAATSSSATNPAGTWDFGAGYGRRIASKGVLGNFTPHMNIGLERSTSFSRVISTSGGMEYQLTPRVAIDASGERIGLTSGPDRQLQVGMTINLGKINQ